MLKSVAANWMLSVATLASAYFLMPFTIHTLGQENYGVWTIIASLTGYLNLLRLGVPMASVRHIVRALAEGDPGKVQRIVSTFGRLYLLLGAAAIVISAGLLVIFLRAFEIPADVIADARLAFILVAFALSVEFFGQLPYGILSAHHDFVTRNAILTGSVLLRVGLVYVFLQRFPSVLTLAILQVVLFALEMVACWIVLRWRYPAIRLDVRQHEPGLLRGIFAFSMYVMVISVGTQLAYQTDSLVIGYFLGVSAIVPYAVANSLTVYFMEFLLAIAAVVMPMSTKLQAEGDLSGLRGMYLKWSKISLSLTLLGGVFMLVLGPRFLGWWLGAEFEVPAGRVLRILMVSYLIFLPVRTVVEPILMGLGKPRQMTVAFVVAGILNLIMSVALVRPFGLVGVAWGTAIPNVLFAVWLLVLGCREMGVSIRHYLYYVVGRAAIGALPVAALLWWCLSVMDVRSLPALALSGAASVLLFAGISVAFVYRRDPHVDLMGTLRSLRR